MSDDAGEKHRAGFAGIVLLLRQLAQQLIAQGNATEARGLVDGIEALQAKSQGNLDEGEATFLEEVLYELRMAVVAGPSKAAGEDAADAPDEAAPSGETAGETAGEAKAEDAKRPPEPAGE